MVKEATNCCFAISRKGDLFEASVREKVSYAQKNLYVHRASSASRAFGLSLYRPLEERMWIDNCLPSSDTTHESNEYNGSKCFTITVKQLKILTGTNAHTHTE